MALPESLSSLLNFNDRYTSLLRRRYEQASECIEVATGGYIINSESYDEQSTLRDLSHRLVKDNTRQWLYSSQNRHSYAPIRTQRNGFRDFLPLTHHPATMDITYTLQRMCLQPTTQKNSHVIFLEYPVTSLIPNRPGVGLRMSPPKAALYREAPNSDKFFLGEHGLEFFVRFSVEDSSVAKHSSSATIDTAIDRLSHSGGRSILEAVTVSDHNYSESGYIFRLTTIWHDNREKEVSHF